MLGEISAASGLWPAVALSGFYHGASPGMGWPLAVSAGLMGNGRKDLLRALGPLGLGHLGAMLLILLPFALLMGMIRWQTEIRLGAACLVIGAGVWLLFNRRHPRAIARIAPNRLALWSFAVAIAHGAGLMLLPIYLGLCGLDEGDVGHRAAGQLIAGSLPRAVGVSAVHTIAMIAAGGAIAYAVHAWLGLQFLSKSWFNLDVVWAVGLILAGGAGIWGALG